MTDSTQEKPEKSEEKAEAAENSITSTTESTTDFVEDWTIVDTLGEGSFGEVKLLLHKVTKEAVAVKIIDHSKHEDAALVVKKEVAIHRTLQHPNIIRYLGVRKDPVKEYIFLEYASGGELFDKIEPDMGMPMSEAQKYFKQLLSGVQYLHSRGIVHRDIKPENLLLDKKNDLKITDFGMATVFRMKGVERNLESRCGTLPYMAPEVVTAFYKGRPADIWSCGITLIAMLSGELPWDIASDENKEYKAWLEGKYMTVSPWRKIDNMPLSLCRSILAINPEARYTIDRINEHRWMRTDFNENKYERKQFNPASNKKRYIEYQDENIQVNTNTIIALSQPAPQNQVVAVERVNIQEHELQCFSQPTGLGDLLLNTGIQFSQSPIDKTNFEKLVSRMTRFFVTTDSVKTLELLVKHLQTKTTYNWNLNGSGTITIRTVDSRKNPLVFKAKILNMEHKILLDFRLSKGCGLEFKKRFLHLKNCLSSIILDD